MMFVGAIPRECVEQVLRIHNLDRISDVFVCCSGSFRFEQALTPRGPDLRIHSNDVSLFSVALGRFAMGDPVRFRFCRELAFLEEALVSATPIDRIAALCVALRMCHFRGKSEYMRAHLEHYRQNASHYIERAGENLAKYVAGLRVTTFFAGDFREHAEHAIGAGGLVLAWPPLFKGDYERLYRLIHMNTEWEPPSYATFNPSDLPAWLTRLDEARARYCVCTDRLLEDRTPVALYSAGRQRRIYVYGSAAIRSSVRRTATASEPFKYTPVQPTALTARSHVEVIEVGAHSMNFIKDKYQIPGLVHTDGNMRWMVFIDGHLGGGFVYALPSTKVKYKDPRIKRQSTIYVLSDFSVTRLRKVSKLVAMLATGLESVRRFDLKYFQRTQTITTTAFTKRPVSMKYRGIYHLMMRAPDHLNYFSEVRRVSNQDIYDEWWRRYAARDKGGSSEAE